MWKIRKRNYLGLILMLEHGNFVFLGIIGGR
jgi:hypothetical protein